MTSGKFDDELGRMSAVVDRISPTSLLLCNESFASTNELEGTEIGEQVVDALLSVGVRVVIVTHLYELAHRWHVRLRDEAVFPRAERDPDGTRTFRVTQGEPEPTSYGEDLYQRIVVGTGPVDSVRR